MFFIEYRSFCFVDANHVSEVYFFNKEVRFNKVGDAETGYIVEENYTESFLNHFQAFNKNITNLELRYKEHVKYVDNLSLK